MPIRAVSHIAIGVREMERSLRFYRDLLGLRVTLDRVEPAQDQPNAPPPRRRAVYLRWEDGQHSTFVVLDQQFEQHGEPTELFQVGLHHVAFWVDDLKEMYQRLVDAGVPIVHKKGRGDSQGYGEIGGEDVYYAFFEDPDGTVIQLDQRVSFGDAL